jgi:acetyltransferase EpsM
LEAKRVIVGAGRHSLETYYLLQDISAENNIDFAIDAPEKEQKLAGRKVWSIRELLDFHKQNINKPAVLVAIGDLQSNKRLVKVFSDAGFSFFNAIDNSINQQRQKHIGKGVTILWGSILTCNISIGDHTIINIGCTISHDCFIGNHVNISPGCHLAGKVTIEDDVFIGTGATFIPDVKVGTGSIVAAGACVISDIPPYSLVAGVPAVIKKTLQ